MVNVHFKNLPGEANKVTYLFPDKKIIVISIKNILKGILKNR